jgi:DNA repair exonuclease SbcCD ATPase subunit
MPTWAWIPIAVFLVGLAGASAALVLLAIEAYRRLRAAGRTLNTALEELTRKSSELERRAAELSDRVEQLQAARSRLRSSLDKLEVLKWALGDAGRLVALLRTVSGK